MWGIILKSLTVVLGKALVAMGSEELVKWVLFKLADAVVESTKTPHDNEWLAEFKKAYDKVGK